MIKNIGKVNISPGIEYISDWKDSNGNLLFDQVLDNSRLIVNKVVTGCGFTTYCLINKENTIIVSPRTWLIHEKIRKHGGYYFNREFNDKKEQIPKEELLSSLVDYIKWCKENDKPIKIFVTYDSFCTLVDSMENELGIDIRDDYRIVIDESQSLIKDVPLKEYNNKRTLSYLMERLFHYERLLFISATPLIDYLSEVTQFKMYPVKYVELQWSALRKIRQKFYDCRSALDAFDKIYHLYSRQVFPDDKVHHFDVKFYPGKRERDYSTEAVIFLNSVADIKKIVNKYVNKNQLIDVNDITIICARTEGNAQALKKMNKRLHIADAVPLEGEHHTTWTFVTRTAFEGVDFYSSNASTYVIANYNVDSLCLDIASDLPQIIGRQRLKSNIFRNTIHIYCTNNSKICTPEEFDKYKQDKINASYHRISIYDKLEEKNDKDCLLEDYTSLIEVKPTRLYLETTSGKPKINPLMIISEQYIYDILNNQIGFYMIPKEEEVYTESVIQEFLSQLDSTGLIEGKIKIACDWYKSGRIDKDDMFSLLDSIGLKRITYYLSTLPIERIIANSYDPWEMDKEIDFIDRKGNISDYVSSVFRKGEVYLAKDVKWMLQEVYDKLGILKTAKATDLPGYIECKGVFKNRNKAYKIL